MQTPHSQAKLFSLRYTMPSSLLRLLFSFDTCLMLLEMTFYSLCCRGLKSRPECGIPLYYECSWICHHVNFVKFGSLCKVCLLPFWGWAAHMVYVSICKVIAKVILAKL